MTEQLASLLTQKQALDEQIAQTYAQAKQSAIEQAKSLIQAHNLTQTELGIKASPLKGRKAPVKYTGPNGETWSGRGRTPKWFQEDRKEIEAFEARRAANRRALQNME